jgi:hypothetical protein
MGYAIDFAVTAIVLCALYIIISPFILLIDASRSNPRLDPWYFLTRSWSGSWIISVVVLVFTAVIVSRLGRYIDHERKLTLDNLEKEITGAINIYGSISLNELSGKIGANVDETEKWLARLQTEKKFDGIIDGDRIVHSFSESKRNIPEEKATQVTTQVAKESSKDKLKKLEELYKEGKISEHAYIQLKEKYEEENDEARAR